VFAHQLGQCAVRLITPAVIHQLLDPGKVGAQPFRAGRSQLHQKPITAHPVGGGQQVGELAQRLADRVGPGGFRHQRGGPLCQRKLIRQIPLLQKIAQVVQILHRLGTTAQPLGNGLREDAAVLLLLEQLVEARPSLPVPVAPRQRQLEIFGHGRAGLAVFFQQHAHLEREQVGVIPALTDLPDHRTRLVEQIVVPEHGGHVQPLVGIVRVQCQHLPPAARAAGHIAAQGQAVAGFDEHLALSAGATTQVRQQIRRLRVAGGILDAARTEQLRGAAGDGVVTRIQFHQSPVQRGGRLEPTPPDVGFGAQVDLQRVVAGRCGGQHAIQQVPGGQVLEVAVARLGRKHEIGRHELPVTARIHLAGQPHGFHLEAGIERETVEGGRRHLEGIPPVRFFAQRSGRLGEHRADVRFQAGAVERLHQLGGELLELLDPLDADVKPGQPVEPAGPLELLRGPAVQRLLFRRQIARFEEARQLLIQLLVLRVRVDEPAVHCHRIQQAPAVRQEVRQGIQRLPPVPPGRLVAHRPVLQRACAERRGGLGLALHRHGLTVTAFDGDRRRVAASRGGLGRLQPQPAPQVWIARCLRQLLQQDLGTRPVPGSHVERGQTGPITHVVVRRQGWPELGDYRLGSSGQEIRLAGPFQLPQLARRIHAVEQDGEHTVEESRVGVSGHQGGQAAQRLGGVPVHAALGRDQQAIRRPKRFLADQRQRHAGHAHRLTGRGCQVEAVKVPESLGVVPAAVGQNAHHRELLAPPGRRRSGGAQPGVPNQPVIAQERGGAAQVVAEHLGVVQAIDRAGVQRIAPQPLLGLAQRVGPQPGFLQRLEQVPDRRSLHQGVELLLEQGADRRRFAAGCHRPRLQRRHRVTIIGEHLPVFAQDRGERVPARIDQQGFQP